MSYFNKIKIFYFNPTCEMAIANGESTYNPPTHLKKFEDDLAMLPYFLCDSKDFVLVPKNINLNFIEYLQSLGFNLPNFVTSAADLPKSTHIQLISPWGWSPAAHKKLNQFIHNCSPNWENHPMSKWKSSHSTLLSRETTYKFIAELIKIKNKSYNLIEIPFLPLKVNTLEDIKNLHEKISPPILLKTPLSASGRGHFKIRDLHEHAEKSGWIKSKLLRQKHLFAEPFLNKVLDVSFHFMVEENEIKYLGNTFFETDAKGQFTGCHVGFPKQSCFDKFFLTDTCLQAKELLLSGLHQLEINKDYQGPLGIDAIFFEKPCGTISLNPCVEVNLRHTMGLVNILLRQRIHPEKNGIWEILSENINVEDFKHSKNSIREGFIWEGFFLLTLPIGDSGYVVRLKVE